MLLAKGRQGSYLVRESQSQPGQYALAVRCNNGIQQIIIRHRETKYDIGSGPTFSSLRELVEYYVQNPKLHDIKDQSPIKLREVLEFFDVLFVYIIRNLTVECNFCNFETLYKFK